MSDRPPRRLLPAAAKDQLSEQNVSEHEPPLKSRGKGVTRISTACEACKRRKSRCSGPPAPCTLCRAQETECRIDESLDQRKKVTAYRPSEQATGQQQLLTALVQSIRYSELNDFQELAISIRNNLPATDIAAVLKRNVENLNGRGTLWPIDIADLGSAFMSSGVSLPSHEHEPSVRTSESSTTAQSSARTSPNAHSTPTADGSRPQSGKRKQSFAEQIKIYQRWISLFGSAPDPTADSRLERHPGSEDGLTPWHTGLWRKSSEEDLSAGVSAFESQRHETTSKRIGWHPALMIQIAQEDDTRTAPIQLSPAEEAQLSEVTSLIETQESEGWVETLRGIPNPIDALDGNHGELDVPYHLDFARFPLFAVQPIATYENSPLSRVITDYLFAARTTLEQGMAPIEILGYDGIDVALFFRDREPDDAYTVSEWAAELWRSFHDWDIYVRLACCLSSTYIMRWLLVPTAKRYADVPEILKPVPIQRIKPHHIAIDLLPVPCLREALVKNLKDFMTALPAAHISVNWTGTMAEAVTEDEGEGCLRLTEAFEKHVIKLENWSIGRSVLSDYPELEGSIRIDRGK